MKNIIIVTAAFLLTACGAPSPVKIHGKLEPINFKLPVIKNECNPKDPISWTNVYKCGEHKQSSGGFR